MKESILAAFFVLFEYTKKMTKNTRSQRHKTQNKCWCILVVLATVYRTSFMRFRRHFMRPEFAVVGPTLFLFYQVLYFVA